MLTALLLLTPVAAIAVLVWNHQRKAAAREAASSERLKVFLSKSSTETAANDAHAAPAPAPVSIASAAPGTVRAAALPMSVPAGFAARDRILTRPQTLLYYLLKTNLPDYEVLAQVSFAAFIAVDAHAAVIGLEREARQRRLAAAVADFLVCNKSFKAVAAVQCAARAADAPGSVAFARACCESAGLRWVEIAPDALPKRDEIRQRVLGA